MIRDNIRPTTAERGQVAAPKVEVDWRGAPERTAAHERLLRLLFDPAAGAGDRHGRDAA